MAPGWEYDNNPFTTASPYLYGLPSTTADTLLHIDDLIDLPANVDHSSSPAPQPPAAPPPIYAYPQLGSVADDLFLPQCEVAAELEWLSNFVDDSFSSHATAIFDPYYTSANNSPVTPLHTEQPLPPNNRGARSKRSRAAAPSPILCHPTTTTVWSRLAHSMASTTSSSSSSSEFPPLHSARTSNKSPAAAAEESGGVRRCTHCASDKTPQWRTGPLGPKSLCNACGVRYKSGRLVPEYRPAASPTFVLTQHSNSHRKVLELRRQKELLHPAAA